jgi:hypothetical protein
MPVERQAKDWVRRGPRRQARLIAEAEWPDGARGTVVVTQMSYTGCRLASTRDFVRGETVRLFLPDLGQIHAQIRWAREGLAGAHFLTGDSAKDARRARLGV